MLASFFNLTTTNTPQNTFCDSGGIDLPSGFTPKLIQRFEHLRKKIAACDAVPLSCDQFEDIQLKSTERGVTENNIKDDTDLLAEFIKQTIENFQHPFKHIEAFKTYDQPCDGREVIPHAKAKILGKLDNGRLHGFCIIKYLDSSIFKGYFEQGNRVKGRFLFSDNSYYEGDFQGDLFHGEGKFIFPNGKVVDGNWAKGEIHGKAKIFYVNGDVYYGTLLDFKRHGQGVLKLKSGHKYIGEFSHGFINGRGAYYDQNQKLLKYGYWEKGALIKEMNKKY